MSESPRPAPAESIRQEWQTYRRLLRYAMPYRGRLLLGILFGIVFAGSTAGIFPAMERTLGEMFDQERMGLGTIVAIAVILPVLGLIRGIGQFLSMYYIKWVGYRVVHDLRVDLFDRLQELSVYYFTQTKAGELISRTANDTMMVERAVSRSLGDLVRQPFTLLFLVGVVIWLDPMLAFISLVVFPVCLLPIIKFGRRVRRNSRHAQSNLADIVSILQEGIAGVRVIKAFGMEPYERQRFADRCQEVFARLLKVARARSAIEPIIIEISIIGVVLILVYAHLRGIPMQTFVTFALALVALYDPVKKLSQVHLMIQQSSAAADRIFEVLDEHVAVHDLPGAVALEGPIEQIEFRQVGFRYEREPVLQDVSFHVRPGECIAFVGSSGSGKTTLVSLLPRFFDVTEGDILINGRSTRDYTLTSLRKQIGLVTQDTFLFNDTIANNIAYGRRDADPADIERAAARAHAHEFIQALPEGYETVVGDRGVRLSGGQCQRIAIARAILRNPPIMILDEATSALDTESERLVQAALDDLMAHRTVFAIAHRLSTIQHADRIVVLDEGRVAEIGTHEELLHHSGLYRHLYDMQFH